MAAVEFDRVSFSYENGTDVLSEISFGLAQGVTALIGENGAGKSTLLRLIAGELSPSSGVVRRAPGRSRVVYADERLERASASVLRFLDCRDGTAQQLRAELGLTEIAGRAWAALSPGIRRRLQLASSLHEQPDVWLLDEPSTHIDEPTRAVLIDVLRRQRSSVLLVSHDRAMIDAVAKHTLHLSHGRLRSYQGGYGDARRAIDREQAALRHEKSERERVANKERRALDEARRRQTAADHARSSRQRMKGPRDHDGRSFGRKVVAGWAEARLGRSVQVQRRTAEEAEQAARALFVEQPLGRQLFVDFRACPRAQVATLQRESLGYGPHLVLRDLRLVLGRHARVRIEGPNGSGKTTLLSAFYETASRHDADGVLYLPQEITPALIRARLQELRALGRAQKGRVLEIVAALGVDPARLLASSAPSAGEARKLWLALGLARGAHTLMLDEPTNDLDLPSVERLEAALCDYPGALLVITHDAHFAAATLHEHWRIAGQRVL